MRNKPWFAIFQLLLLALCVTDLFATKLSVAIMPLQNISSAKDLGHLSQTIPDSLSTSLKASEDFRVIDKAKVQKAIGVVSYADYSTAFKAGKQLGADIVIFGGYAVIKGIIDVDLEAIDVRTGKIKLSEGKRGNSDIQLFDLIDELCSSMKTRMTKELVSDQAYITRKEEVKIEEIYIQDVKKNQQFLMGLGASFGLLSSKSWTPVGGFTSPGLLSSLSLGYGYGPVSIFISGCPPLIALNETGGMGMAGLKYYLKKIPLGFSGKVVFSYGHGKVISGYDLSINFQSGFILSALWAFNDRFSIEAGAGSMSPENNSGNNQPYQRYSLSSPLLYFEVEWLFSKPYGVSVEFTYCDAKNELGEVIHSFRIQPVLIYKMRF